MAWPCRRFDASNPTPEGAERMADEREPPSPGAAAARAVARLVWDPFLAEYVAQSPGRMSRRELTDACPFCADLTSGRVPPGTQAWIRPNDFPAFQPPQGECSII